MPSNFLQAYIWRYLCGYQLFDPLNPADGRRLVQLLVNYQLPGHDLVLFLGNLTKQFTDLLDYLVQDSVSIWKPCKEIQQYYMHLAFSLDSAKLFKFLVNHGGLFCGASDIFKWEDLLYVLMEVGAEIRNRRGRGFQKCHCDE